MSTDADNLKNVEGDEPRDERAAAVARTQEILRADEAEPPEPPEPDAFADRLLLLKERMKRAGLRERMRLAGLLERHGETDLARRLLERVKGPAVREAERVLGGAAEAPGEVIKFARRLEQIGEGGRARGLLEKVRTGLINEARDILRGTDRSPKDTLALGKNLAALDEFNLGWMVLDRARARDDFGKFDKRVQAVQKRALFTYKDVTQPLGKRLDEALQFLENNADIPEAARWDTLAGATRDQETLGLAGSIYKRKWELDKQERHLRASRDLYRRGHEQTPWGDQGYTSTNYAFVLDQLAHLDPAAAQELREEAREVREKIVRDVPPIGENADGSPSWLADEWFFYSTVGEAHFGLGRYEEAIEWLVDRPEAELVRPPDWEFETTARQLANLVRLQSADADFTRTPAWDAFRKFLALSPWGKGGDVSSEAVRQLPEGKAGLALSGGGFRASLFHIGVLARLAELDVLRRVEVLSCVSGGSIVGAHYYLEVRKLLQENPDADIGKEHYVEIVRRVESEFLAGVQTNIRTNVITDSRAVRRMLRRGYSRTTRLGELYEEAIYSRVADEAVAGGRLRERHMHDLTVRPLLNDRRVWGDFKPRNHNWRREAKAPILILNAATLNTGHNWQFTATYMGESPATIDNEVDSVYRLRRKYYTEAPHTPSEPQGVRLGAAVAASSCVPVLFEPVVLDDIYEARGGGGVGRKISVKLVDGGVCDNQGVAGLLEQDCTVLLVSDGSGHLGALDRPSDESLNVGLRSNDILQARIRGTQFRELDARLSAAMLNGMMFVHLKKGLDNPPVDWRGCPDERRHAAPDDRNVLTKYGVSKEVQRRLAAIRTDLDSFNDQEAYALMLSGYRMTRHEFRECLAALGDRKAADGRGEEAADEAEEEANVWGWKFLNPKLRRAMKEPGAGQDKLNALLDAGGGLFLKIWKLDEELQARARRWKKLMWAALIVSAIGLLAVPVTAGLALYSFFFAAGRDAAAARPETLTWVGVGAALLVVVAFLAALALVVFCLWKLRGVPDRLDAIAHTAVGGALLVVGGPAARIHMRKYEGRYIERGKLDNLP